jgi:hypothetical protein
MLSEFYRVEVCGTWKPQNALLWQKEHLNNMQKTSTPEEIVHVDLGRIPVLVNELDDDLTQYCVDMEGRFCGLKSKETRNPLVEVQGKPCT